jgi:sigma-B regulation protein RsbU (phosphoserine phosphatase)
MMTASMNAQQPGDRLALLYRLSQNFNSSLDLNEVLNRVIDEVIEILHAERGFIMLFGPDGSQTFSVARGLERRTIDQPHSQVSQSVVQKVASEGQPILTSDAQSDSRFNMRQSVMLLGLRSILCVPLKVKDEVKGVVYADNRFEAAIFTQADLDLLSAIASIAAIAVENARLYQMAVEQGRMQRELQMAREMQTTFLPQEVPQVHGWEFASRWHPAREVAGDYYDFIPVGPDSIGLVIADVTDKGAPAALFMVFSNSIVRGSVHPSISPADAMANSNRLICAKSPNAMFVSLVYIQVDLKNSRATYVNAGHNMPLYYQHAEDRLQSLSRTGMVMGIEPETPYTQRDLALEPGDFLVLYTDGLTDAINASGQEFGVKRLEELILENRHASVDEIINRLDEAVILHTGDITPFDDITLLIAKRL